MLILTRRVGEAIHIGAEVEVVILGVKGNQIRVGTRAPIEVAVHRAEIFKRIQGSTNSSAPTLSAPSRDRSPKMMLRAGDLELRKPQLHGSKLRIEKRCDGSCEACARKSNDE